LLIACFILIWFYFAFGFLGVEEIDNLTRRSKATETAYTTITQLLADVPTDPTTLLLSVLEHLSSQQGQIVQLTKRVDDTMKENTVLEQTILKLQKNQQPSSSSSSSSSVPSKQDHGGLTTTTMNSSSNSTSTGLGREEKEELIQLRRDVAEYEVEFRSLKNQDITIRKLEAKIVEIQQGGEEELNVRFEKAKQELVETEGRRTVEALEREAAMERKVQTLELQLKAEMAGRAATQAHLLEASEGLGEREAAWEAQRGILVDDAERIRVILHEATRERDELRLKLAALEGPHDGSGEYHHRGSSSSSSSSGRISSGIGGPNSGGIPLADLLMERKAYEAEVSELSHTVNSLREELVLKDTTFVADRNVLQTRIETLERTVEECNIELSHLTTQLESAPSQSLVDSMKRELRILKRLEYNAGDDDDDNDDYDYMDDSMLDRPEIAGRNEDQEKDLESVLVAKLRRMETEIVKERNRATQVTQECDTLRDELKASIQANATADEVIATLEKDLDRALSSTTTTTTSSTPGTKLDTKKFGGTALVLAPSDPNALQSVLDSTGSTPMQQQTLEMGGNEINYTSATSSSSSSVAEKVADDHSVATIVMAQRDRLRARCEALEAERDSFKRELQVQVDASESLQADNTKLFEKLRYLQSYNGGINNNSNNNMNSVVSVRSGSAYTRQGSLDLDLEALEQRYEASVDPFRQFSKSERQRKLKEMSPMERTVFVVAKTMLGTKEMRTFLFFYVLTMHLLVFMTTYHWSHGDDTYDCTMHHELLSNLPPVPSKLSSSSQ
jgi:homeobox protein cut-like